MTRTSYHHGRLREELINTGVELARAGGPAAVVLREAARRLQVSPTAAYRHFSDRSDLLLAVRAAALRRLARRMLDTADPADPLLHFRGLGQAYVEFALDEPGLFRTLATPGVPLPTEEPSAEPEPFRLLSAALDALVTAGQLPAERRPDADAVAWSAVHGLAVLLLDGLLPHDQAGALTDRTLNTVAFGLLPAPATPPVTAPDAT